MLTPTPVLVYDTHYPAEGVCQHWESEFEGVRHLATGKYRVRESMSNDRCLTAGDRCDESETQGWAAHPVNTRSGNFAHQEVDFSIPTRRLPLQFERSYNSLDTTVGALGRGWTHNYAARLIFDTYQVTYVAPRGSHLPFYRKGDGTFALGAGVRATLVQDPDGSYRLTQGDQVTSTFDASGRLTAIGDPTGDRLELTSVAYHQEGIGEIGITSQTAPWLQQWWASANSTIEL